MDIRIVNYDEYIAECKKAKVLSHNIFQKKTL